MTVSMCEVCGTETPFLCSKCFCVAYCSEKCQFDDWRIHKLICEDEHMSLLRKKACELCESHFTPLFEVRQDPTTNNAYWHMTNASGSNFSLGFSLTHDMSEMDLLRRFALLQTNQDEECAICFELKKMRENQEEKKCQIEPAELTSSNNDATKKAERQRQRRKAKKKRIATAKANQYVTTACHKSS